jgi:hypothetical protein
MRMLQTSGSYDGASDFYTVSLSNENLCVTLDGLSYHDVEALADLAYCLLYREGEPFTWHNEYEPNDVY